MKVLVLMCGIQCSGKSSFIKSHELEKYRVSSDELRRLYSGETITPSGNNAIAYDQRKESMIWDTIHDIVRSRLEDGQFTIVDAMNVRKKNFQRFLQIAKDTRSRVYVVDMMKATDLESCLKRNQQREFNQIPASQIIAAYKNYQQLEWPKSVTVISPDEFEDKVYLKPEVVNHEHVAVIGDIHGCFDTLMEGLKQLPEDCLKVFVGDYCDRGPQNVEMINWLIEHRNDEDKIFLTGNHEAHLVKYAHDKPTPSKEFNEKTAKQFNAAGVDKKGIRQFCSKLRQIFWFKLGDKQDVLVNHGGVSTVGKNPVFVSTCDYIRGSGDYEDMGEVAESWGKLEGVEVIHSDEDVYARLHRQVHGHRNIAESWFYEESFCINLEDHVEADGSLRIALFQQGHCLPEEISIRSQSYREKGADVEDLVEKLRASKYIKEKQFGDVSSFNFTRRAFYNDVWDNLTEKARGLYINTKTNQIVARGFDKFFNIGERPDTSLQELAQKVKYPVAAYQKENGFLGLVGFDHANNEPIITSKSDMNGPYAGYVKENLLAMVGEDGLKKVTEFVKENNCTLALEICDKERDPHIIEYPESDVFLLAVIYNELDFKQMPFEEAQKVAQDLGLNCKQLIAVINNEKEWLEFFEKDHGEIEGFVLEDSTGYMVKRKTPYYDYWKHKRYLLESSGSKTQSDDDYRFLTWFAQTGLDWNTNIIKIRKIWESEGEQNV